jgi:hypothetical protein
MHRIDEQNFILATNRDEYATRPEPLFPNMEKRGGTDILFPKDEPSGGTWIACSGNMAGCLLNGAFVPHEDDTVYTGSRGQLLLSMFEYPTPHAFAHEHELHGVAPFTMVMLDYTASIDVSELRWDGNVCYYRQIEHIGSLIWSSSVIYSRNIIKKREQWLQDWFGSRPLCMDSVRSFHLEAGEGNVKEDLVMRRTQVCTLSSTFVVGNPQAVEMSHLSLRTNQVHRQTLQRTGRY